jgi:tRNA threonylcarbamoyladenosine biosynthesis protein TsaE
VKYQIKTLEETKEVAHKLIAKLTVGERATVLAMDGDLGSGKTTLSQFIGQELGVRDVMPSPTFLIQKIYELKEQKWKHLIHIDAYRLEKEGELLSLGWRDLISDSQNLIIVEWAERVKNIMAKSAIHIVLRHAEEGIHENRREIEVNTP